MSTPQSNLDSQVKQRVGALLDKLQSYLPEGWGIMTWVYDRVSPTLEVTVFATDEADVSETLRVMRATAAKLLQQESKRGTTSAERWFDSPLADLHAARSDLLVSSAAVTTLGGHDHVRVWSRGGLAGELIMNAGDGAIFATSALQLVEREPVL